jgi:Tfp pilus assembly protein PilX
LNLTDDYGTSNVNANAWFDGVSLVDTTGGADVTSANTSNDTSYVSGVPSSTIASVVPTGYKLYINSGSKSYSIEAI